MSHAYILHFLFLFLYLNGNAKADKCELMQGKELESFFRDVIADTISYEDGISAESRLRISREIANWDSTDIKLPRNVVLPRSREARSFYQFTYIYRPKIADTIFKAADRKYIKCQVMKYLKQKQTFPEMDMLTLVIPERKGEKDYYYYTYPLVTADHKYAVVKRMRPQTWIETTKGYTYNTQILYYKRDQGRWLRIYDSGFWY